jgi:hypothetical protein
LIPVFLLALTFPITGIAHLPPGVTEVATEIKLPDGAHDLTIAGNGTTLRATASFHGRAIMSCKGCRRIAIRDLSIDGNRAALAKPMPLPPTDWSFARFFPDNGMLFEDAAAIRIERVTFINIANFAVLVTRGRDIVIEHLKVENSGSTNAKGRDNTTGGVLLEEGAAAFTVADSEFRNIRGNAVWTHSCYGSPRNSDGKIANNRFFDIGRDAIQVGHATRVEVTGNTGARIGMNAAGVDIEGGGVPVGIDTAGNVDRSTYANNRFEEIDGKCIDLDGFHDGAVRGNTCINRGKPEDYPYGNFGIAMNDANIDMRSENIVVEGNTLEGMKFGGIFVIGEGHRIVNNRMTRLNTAHCNETHAKFGCLAIAGEPGFLESGIYLAKGGARPSPSRHVVIQNNVIGGYKMSGHCIEAAPSVKMSENTIKNNKCTDE